MSGVRHKWICAKLARPAFGWVVGCASMMLVVGCASMPSSSNKLSEEQRVRKLERELRRTKNQLDEVKERNLVLERRLNKDRRVQRVQEPAAQTIPVPFDPTAAVEARSAEVPAALPAFEPKTRAAAIPGTATPVLEKVGAAQTGEHFLYSKILETYRQHKSAELNKSLQMFLKTYPDSVFADNSLYLAGLLAMESNDNTRATEFMNRVLKIYPKGNKAVSALFAKAIIEKRNKKYDEAKQLFEKVRRMYPGSPESKRVSVELKLLQIAANSKRES